MFAMDKPRNFATHGFELANSCFEKVTPSYTTPECRLSYFSFAMREQVRHENWRLQVYCTLRKIFDNLRRTFETRESITSQMIPYRKVISNWLIGNHSQTDSLATKVQYRLRYQTFLSKCPGSEIFLSNLFFTFLILRS